MGRNTPTAGRKEAQCDSPPGPAQSESALSESPPGRAGPAGARDGTPAPVGARPPRPLRAPSAARVGGPGGGKCVCGGVHLAGMAGEGRSAAADAAGKGAVRLPYIYIYT